jgi:DNA-binding transcriptional ArsR family regulator
MTKQSSQLVANVFKALSHPARLQIIKFLVKGRLCVCDILPKIELEQSNVSQHLAVLRNQGILSSSKEGTMVFYEIISPEVVEMIRLAEQMIIRQTEETRLLVEDSF